MKYFPKRYLEEFFLYSSQFVLFFILLLLSSPNVIRPKTVALVSLVVFLLVQIALLAIYGHIPSARFFLSFMTPLGFTVMNVISGNPNLLDMAGFFLWIFVIYLGGIQALALRLRKKWPKRMAEVFLSLGTILTFIFFYFYLDLRFNCINKYENGLMGYDELIYSLSLANFGQAFKEFVSSLQNIFFMFGSIVFGSFLVASKLKQISLKTRLDQIYNVTDAPIAEELEEFASKPVAETKEIVLLYSDLWNFTAQTEKYGPEATIDILNRYYGQWDIIAKRHGGIVNQFMSDTAIIVFGLLDEKNAADNAVNCALDFLEEFSHFQEDLTESHLPFIKNVGIGVHSGKVAVGEFLSAAAGQKIGIIGESVNTAARLDSLCREFKQNLIISQSAYKNLNLESQEKFRPIGEVLFRGNNQPQTVYKKK